MIPRFLRRQVQRAEVAAADSGGEQAGFPGATAADWQALTTPPSVGWAKEEPARAHPLAGPQGSTGHPTRHWRNRKPHPAAVPAVGPPSRAPFWMALWCTEMCLASPARSPLPLQVDSKPIRGSKTQRPEQGGLSSEADGRMRRLHSCPSLIWAVWALGGSVGGGCPYLGGGGGLVCPPWIQGGL